MPAHAAGIIIENNSLAGDKGRESLQESKESWKEQIREKLAENTVSQLTNGLLNPFSGIAEKTLLGFA